MTTNKANKSQIASFDVDAQKTFTPLCPDELPVEQGDQIVSELNAQAKLAQYRIGSKDAHPANAVWVANEQHPPLTPVAGDNVDIHWPRHAVPGTRGFELLDGLPRPIEYDYFIWKGVEPDLHPYGACFHDLAQTRSTGVIEFLHAHHITTILVGGLATDYCVRATVLSLCQAGFQVILNKAACRGVNPGSTKKALDDMQAAGTLIYNSAKDIKPPC